MCYSSVPVKHFSIVSSDKGNHPMKWKTILFTSACIFLNKIICFFLRGRSGFVICTQRKFCAVLAVVLFVWMTVYVIHTIYNGIQQEQVVPFSRSGDKSVTKWPSRPHEGQQVHSHCTQRCQTFPLLLVIWFGFIIKWVFSDVTFLTYVSK